MNIHKIINTLVEMNPELEFKFLDPAPGDRTALKQFLMRNARISEEESEALIRQAEENVPEEPSDNDAGDARSD